MQALHNYPRAVKLGLMLVCDSLLLPLALWSAVAMRMGSINPAVDSFYQLFLLLPLLSVPVFYLLGLYRTVIRYANDRIVFVVVAGVLLSQLLITAIVVFFQFSGLPRSAILIYGVVASFYIVGSRLLVRRLLGVSIRASQPRKERVAIYGAGQAGTQTALALLSGPGFDLVAFFDDDPQLIGRSILGVTVFSGSEALATMASKQCEQLLFALPSVARQRRREIIESFEGKGIKLKTIPGIGDLVGGKVRVEDIREVGVEDLLGRDPVPPIEDLFSSCISNKIVLVTGAGGSIGSELCRQILRAAPRRLLLLDHSEFLLYQIHQSLQLYQAKCDIQPILLDIKNTHELEHLLKSQQVETLYHAAAYKHVPLLEANALSGIQNNVFGTWSSAKAAMAAEVETFVLVSTDKAVRPTNLMGCTKRLAEMVLQALAPTGTKTRFCMVRFGNVLGSSGSVIPLFKKQIKAGGPLSVTHPEVTRYFMTIPEAAQLVIQAGAMGEGGDLFVLDMGEPIKIMDLAKRLIEFSGFQVYDPKSNTGDIAIQIIGLRPGEKLYEELLIGDNSMTTKHPRIMKARESFLPWPDLLPKLEALRDHCQQQNIEAAVTALKALVPEAQLTRSSQSGQNLLH